MNIFESRICVVNDIFGKIKRIIVGKPMHSHKESTKVLPNYLAISILGAVMLSSIAYVPDEIFIVLSMNNLVGNHACMIIILLVIMAVFIIAFSYGRIIRQFPKDNNDYEITSTNLSQSSSIFMGSTLLVSYALLLSVSISASAHYLTILFPALSGDEIFICFIIILLLALINLRGIPVNHKFFSIPSFAFLILIFALLSYGFYEYFSGNLPIIQTVQYDTSLLYDYSHYSVFYSMLTAFASGCVLACGIGVIFNNVCLFDKPVAKNSFKSMLILLSIVAIVLISVFFLANEIGIKRFIGGIYQILFHDFRIRKINISPIIGQLGTSIFSNTNIVFDLIIFMTAIILVIAGNIAFHAFTNLASLLSRDRFLPRQLYKRGDRLTYSNGIIVLVILSCFLVFIFGAELSSLIQLYTITIFIIFTLSQFSIVKYWNKKLCFETQYKKRKYIKHSFVINILGMTASIIILLIIIITRDNYTTVIIFATIFVVFTIMKAIDRHYNRVSKQLNVEDYAESRVLPSRVHAIVLVSKLHKPSMRAIAYARATNPSSIEILTVAVDDNESEKLYDQWENSGLKIPLTFVHSPFREITGPLIRYVRSMRKSSPSDLVVIFIPEYLVPHWWENILHNKTARNLKTRLLFIPGVVLSIVPWRIDDVEDRYVNIKSRVDAPEDVILENKNRDN